MNMKLGPSHGRRSTIATAATIVLLSALAACGSDDSGPTASGGVTTIKVMAIPGNAYRLPIVVAEKEGYFKEAGLKIEFVDQPLTMTGPQALIATKAQVGFASAATVPQAWQSGQRDVAAFCGGYDHFLTTFVVKKDSPIPSTDDGSDWKDVAKALDGKTIGIQAPVGSGSQLLFAAGLAEAGVEVNWVTVGGDLRTASAALQNGSVDVIQAEPTGTQYMVNSGDVKPVLKLSQGPEVFKQAYGASWMAPTSWLDSDPEQARGFCDALGKALDFIGDPANASAASEMLQGDASIDAAVADKVISDGVYDEYNTEIPEDRFNATMDKLIEVGALKADPAPTYADIVKTQ